MVEVTGVEAMQGVGKILWYIPVITTYTNCG